ncbi:beta-ketoacyl-[acyl-carrier-protein] synthase family protein [Dissulfurirhabdus thermomarina]|uniref:Beta-ketoacyl-[acyl-carrier-protein] synthase family protein n=1 Tax=Dissulfurirhabdus thermomarina TaxID=1765737 RepID=A0A6N9TNE7_DISTH|nr:beta-ketoacyl-[acyl-carrier-protein] synthase family protein [Dissulfurirhabdus thermomarina]NDY41304.1 beta-ketoacyl-[acyl-carrier-protein] synthase family protein [Dissulfurirhabdus thermomarina]NMX23761.1 beta-ketoacyl-[acyl-carrier-protein] synthase family protein [Dissulfurirhabdus thermomarina]
MDRAAVTGLGIVCCLGSGKEAVWRRLLAGADGFGPLRRAGFEDFGGAVAGEVPDEALAAFSAAADPRWSRFEALGMLAAGEALADAGWSGSGPYPPDRVMPAAGVGAAGMLEAEAWREAVLRGDARVPARQLHGYPVSSLADLLAMTHGWSGPRFSIATACSSSSVALGLAAAAVASGRVDAAVVVGSEALSRLTFAGFHSLRSMDPETCRPFDRRRRGLVLGEGAAALVLERAPEALRRGARVYAEVLGWGFAADAYHMTAPPPNGEGAARAARAALDRAGLAPGDIGYVNLHGTGTRANDPAETRAMEAVFGAAAPDVPMSSTKSVTGHCLGAAGAVESVITVLALHHETAPPTAHLEEPDPECGLDYVPGAPRPIPGVRAALNNVLAFGGNNAALVFGRPGAA